MRIGTLTIVGVGLIGGSIGLAARRRGLCEHVVGVGRRAPVLELARHRGAIDEGCLDLVDAARRADVVVFCTPVDLIVQQALTAAPACRDGTLLTDAGSTKGQIVRGLEERLLPSVAFVGSHPLAGSEKRGPEHADAKLFEHKLTVVTPTSRTSHAAVEKTVAFWEALGSQVRLMDPDAHDRALGLTSHLPHLLASALARVLPPEWYDLTATGFRDTTRVAAGDARLWTGIFLQNRTVLRDCLQQLADSLRRFQEAMEHEDGVALTLLLDQAKKVRDALGS